MLLLCPVVDATLRKPYNCLSDIMTNNGCRKDIHGLRHRGKSTDRSILSIEVSLVYLCLLERSCVHHTTTLCEMSSSSEEEEAEFDGNSMGGDENNDDDDEEEDDDDLPIASLKRNSSSSSRRGSKAPVSYAEDDDDDDDDSEDDIPLAALAPKKKTASPKKPAAAKKAKKPAKRAKTTASSTATTSSKYDSASAALYGTQCVKGLLIQRLLCRWWFAITWPSPDCIPSQPPEFHDSLDGFPGVYVCTQGENVGTILDLRNKDMCPSFQNFAKKDAQQLKEWLLQALQGQKEELVKHEGPGTPTEVELDKLLKWTTKVNPGKADKEATTVLQAAGLAIR